VAIGEFELTAGVIEVKKEGATLTDRRISAEIEFRRRELEATPRFAPCVQWQVQEADGR
jgi:hypothetical protein